MKESSELMNNRRKANKFYNDYIKAKNREEVKWRIDDLMNEYHDMLLKNTTPNKTIK